MTRFPTRSLTIVAMAVLLATGGAGPSMTPPASAQDGPAGGDILLTFAPGGVLTRDGTLWTYHLEKRVWITVDEGFEEQGQKTQVHPLPVPASEIARMESFGFLVTRSGDCWLYDLQEDQWREIGSPPRR